MNTDTIKRNILKYSLLLILVVFIIGTFNAVIRGSNVKERENWLYYELLKLQVLNDAEIIKLVSYKYISGACSLQCDFIMNNNISDKVIQEKIKKCNWEKQSENDMFVRYTKDKIALDLERKDNTYVLVFTDCQNDLVAYWYNLPQTK